MHWTCSCVLLTCSAELITLYSTMSCAEDELNKVLISNPRLKHLMVKFCHILLFPGGSSLWLKITWSSTCFKGLYLNIDPQIKLYRICICDIMQRIYCCSTIVVTVEISSVTAVQTIPWLFRLLLNQFVSVTIAMYC